jgi:hypothetical protein
MQNQKSLNCGEIGVNQITNGHQMDFEASFKRFEN